MNRMDGLGMDTARMITMPLCDRAVTAEVSGEYTLPDYQPEIRRLLLVEPTVLPPAKYIGASGAEFNGTVEYQMTYVGADGGLYTAPLSAEYGFSVPLEQTGDFDLNEGVVAMASTACEGLTTRVIAPRRLSIRCRLRSHVRAYGQMLMEERQSGAAEEGSVQRLFAEAQTMRVACGSSERIDLADELTVTGEDCRVISADAVAFVHEVRPSEGEVEAVGELLLKLMIGREDGSVEQVTRRLPFEGAVEMEALGADASCRVSGVVSDLTVNVEEGKILCEIGLLLEARGMENHGLRYTSDLYSTERVTDCAYREYDLPVALKCENGNLSQSERIPLSQINFPEGATIADARGSVRFDNCVRSDGKYILTGESRYWLLCKKEGEYSVCELTLPLRYETEGCEKEPVCFDAIGEVISCRARVEGETLNLDAELSVVADFSGVEPIRALSEASFGEKYDCQGNRIVVYYPAPEDTPWSVAKKYHVSADTITQVGSYFLL